METVFVLVLGGILALILVSQWRALSLARRQRGDPAPPQAAGCVLPTVYYFHSPRCAPCRSLSPRIDALAQRHPGQVITVDVSEDPAQAASFHVRATPTTVLVKDGLIVEVLLGPQSAKRLEALLPGPQ